jgi:hypothetical protein
MGTILDTERVTSCSRIGQATRAFGIEAKNVRGSKANVKPIEDYTSHE